MEQEQNNHTEKQSMHVMYGCKGQKKRRMISEGGEWTLMVQEENDQRGGINESGGNDHRQKETRGE